ncbi:MAG TPA: transporter substrate-binding domain-containing protein [Polyangia bacterium]|nr:transporter substrate-binding domain-containing protein [Polyangia bacterium]
MRLVAAAVVLVCAASAGAAPATTPPTAGTLGPSLPAIAHRGVLRVGMFPGLAPFVAAGADADELARLAHVTTPPAHATDGRAVAGFDVDLAAAAAHALGVKLEIVLVERFDDLLPGLVDGRYDVVMSGLTRTLDRARTVAFSDPYFASGLEVLVPQSTTYATLPALAAAHARVAVRAGTTAESFARATLAGASVVALPTDAAVLGAIDRGEVDAAVIDYVTSRDAEVRGRLHAPLQALEDRRFTVEHFAFAVRQGDADWLAWLDLMLREAKASGAFHALAARYNPWFRSER